MPVAVAAAAILVGCATPKPPPLSVRIDGRTVAGNPALEQQIAIDKTVCSGESQKANLSAGTNYTGGIVARAVEENRKDAATASVFEGCMASKGYVLSSAEGAQALSDSFAATNKDRQKLAQPQPQPQGAPVAAR